MNKEGKEKTFKELQVSFFGIPRQVITTLEFVETVSYIAERLSVDDFIEIFEVEHVGHLIEKKLNPFRSHGHIGQFLRSLDLFNQNKLFNHCLRKVKLEIASMMFEDLNKQKDLGKISNPNEEKEQRDAIKE